jgi:hypothetical protein
MVLTAIGATQAAEWPTPASLPSRDQRPDPLTMFDGTKVETKQDWLTKRKPELKELFQHYMYGQRPDPVNALEAVPLHEDKNAFGGAATLTEYELRFDVNGHKNPTPIRLLLVVPNGARGPVPCFVGPNFQGNHALVKDAKVRLPDVWMYSRKPGVVDGKATAEGRGTALDVWAFEKAARRGYAVATFYVGDIQPDRPNVKEGLRGVLPQGGRADDTATIMGWAWGVSRAVDFLTVCPGIDPSRIAVVGHSRLGKTALVAAAFDERIALAIPHQAGCGGSGPSRHDDPKAESVKRITASFPHWFCPNFTAFGGSLDKLPFDQHCLVSLCAPRPVLFSNAAEDLWANPRGQFEILKAATPVYDLLGADGLKAKEIPKNGELVNDRLGYFIREGKHSMTFDDWKTFLDYADKWLK